MKAHGFKHSSRILETVEQISTSQQTQQNDVARSKIYDLEVHTVAHIADWGARAIDVTGNISSSTLSADNCVSIETAEWESVNTGLSAIIARDVVDVDLSLNVQKGTTVDAFILGPEVTVVAELQSGTYPSIS